MIAEVFQSVVVGRDRTHLPAFCEGLQVTPLKMNENPHCHLSFPGGKFLC